MSFGATLGGMGAAARGMGDAAKDIASLRESQQRQDGNALNLRRAQNQEAQDREMLENLRTQDWAKSQLSQPISGQGPDSYDVAPQQPQVAAGVPSTPQTAQPQVRPAGEPGRLSSGPIADANSARLKFMQEQHAAAQKALDDYNAGPKPTAYLRAPLGRRTADETVDDGAGGVYTYEKGSLKPQSMVVRPGNDKQAELLKRLKEADAGLKSAQQESAITTSKVPEARVGAFQPGVRVTQEQAAPVFGSLEQKYGLPQGLMAKIMATESGGVPRPNAEGSGAAGYFQFMPATAKQYGVSVNDFGSESEGAARYMSDLIKRNGGNVQAALAQYGGGFVNGQITPNGAAYVQKVMAANVQAGQPQGGAPTGAQAGQAPAQPGVPQTYAAPAAAAQPTQYDVANMAPIQGQGFVDRGAQIRQQNFRLAQMQLQAARDYPTALAASQMIQKLQIEDQEAQLINLAGAASSRNVQAMNSLVGAFAQNTGLEAPRMVQTQNGGLALLDKSGRPVHTADSWGSMAQWLHGNTSHVLQQKNAELSTLYKTKLAESQGTEDGKRGNEVLKGQVRLEEARIHGQNQIDVASLKNNFEFNQLLVKHELTRDDVEGAQYSPDGRNLMVRTNNGVLTMPVPETLKPGAVATQAPPTQVYRSAGLNPAMFGNNTIAGTPTR